MFKASTIYAAYGAKEQQAARQEQDVSLRAVRNPGSTAALPAFTLEPRTWVQQAADVTDGLLDASKYKSLAVYAEVKLAEALDKAAQACPSSIAGAAAEDCQEGQPVNPLATAVCCQLLGELADMCGPFAPTLLKLREALLPAIYSNCSGPSLCGSRPLQFDMLPWFALAGRLRHQNNQLLEQQAVFSKELAQHQEHMVVVEQQLQGLQAALETGTARAAALEATNAQLVAERTAAVTEAAAATEQAKILSADVTRLTAELDVAQEQLATVKEEFANQQESWKAQLDVYMQKLHVEGHERAAALALAATEQQELEQKLWEAERRLEEAEQQLCQHSSSKALQEQQQLTPRPIDWGPAAELAAVCQSTAETVRQLQQQHAQQVAGLQRQAQLLAALAAPEPPAKVWQLNMRADTSKYFLTELDTDPAAMQGAGAGSAGPAKPKLFVTGLGLGADVPRFLRWDAAVEVRDVSLQELEQQVEGLWKAKAAGCSPCSLQAFVHQHFWVQATEAAKGPAASPPAEAAASSLGPAASTNSDPGGPTPTSQPAEDPGKGPAGAAEGGPLQVNGRGSSSDGSSSNITLSGSSAATSNNTSSSTAPASTAAGVVEHAAAMGYQLYYACCTHRHDSAAVELLWQELTGQRAAPELRA